MERKNGGTKYWKKEKEGGKGEDRKEKGVGKESGRTYVQIAGRGKQATGRWFTHQVGMRGSGYTQQSNKNIKKQIQIN